MIFKSFTSSVIKVLKSGGIGVLPTDTIYGLVGSALNKKTVARIYKLRRRNPKKPMIVLIGSISDLKKFEIPLFYNSSPLLSKFWPGKVSIVLPCPSLKFEYLHRETKTLAFRFPKPKKFRDFLRKTGPLIAPSANLEGQPPAKTITEAQKYFGAKIDFYVNAGKKNAKPSRLVKILDGKIIELRKWCYNWNQC